MLVPVVAATLALSIASLLPLIAALSIGIAVLAVDRWLATRATLAQAVDRLDDLAQRLSAPDHRAGQRHAITGLPTREPLLQHMTADGRGVLGIVGLTDFDRLCAFDPALGERFLLTIVDRLTRMLPAERFVAQVDRSSVAIWFGAIGEATADVELNAIGYALSDIVVDGTREILPEIRLRLAVLTDPAGAAPLLARTLASLAVKTEAVAATPVADPAGIAGDRYALEQDLRQAAGRGEFALRYQPLIDAGEGRVSGAEALIRWFHPARGQVPPAQFVPVMEAMGLSHEMGMWTLNAAMREARHWRMQGLGPLRVAVNVSGHQLDRDDIALLVSRALERHSLDADALEIELTESVAMNDGGRAAQLFKAVREMGVRIAIDDFGTGYSGFSTLRTLSFDKIKIDREFVTGVDTRRDSQAICQSIVALGRGLGIRVLAEGVERREEYEWLRRHGATHFQGYYFSPPLTSAAFQAFVQDSARLADLLSIDPQGIRSRITERLTA